MSTLCAIGLASLISSAQPKMNPPARDWIATNVCNAAHDSGTDPVLLAAYMLTENRAIDVSAVVPASCGTDRSLFQINSCYQKDRPHFKQIHHPYFGALTAAAILNENIQAFGRTWKAFAAYWNPQQARFETVAAKAYYARYQANAKEAQQHFDEAHQILQSRSGAPVQRTIPRTEQPVGVTVDARWVHHQRISNLLALRGSGDARVIAHPRVIESGLVPYDRQLALLGSTLPVRP